MESVDSALTPLADATGFPVDQLKFVLCILLCYPLGYTHRFVTDVRLRHLYSIIIGVTFLYVCFGLIGLFHFFLSSGVVYGLFQVLPSRKIPTVTFIIMFGYLSSLHIYRMVTDYMGWKMDVTAAIMVLLIKLTSLSYNIRDWVVMKDNPEIILNEWKDNACGVPSLLEYYSYVLFFPTMLSGPAFNLKPYLQYIDGSLFPDKQVPNALYATIKPFLWALFFIVVMVVVAPKFPTERMFTPGGMQEYSILGSLVYLYFSLLPVRCQYYFIWKLAEGAGNLSGLGYTGKDKEGNDTWNRLNNVVPKSIEFPSSVREITIDWNVKTGDWLRNYVYMRQTDDPVKQQPPKHALYLTNASSAFWHGFYPGYYCSFIFAAFVVDIARGLRAHFRPMVTIKNGKEETPIQPQKKVYDALGTLLSLLTFNYGQASFVGLSLSRSFVFYNNFYWCGHIATAFGWLLVFYLNSQKKRETKKE